MAEVCYNIDCPHCTDYQCRRSCTCITQLTDGYWYHNNGKLGGEFHPIKPNDEERYGEYVKVKHGEWETPKGYPNVLLCSECNTPYEKHEFVATPNYCPNCGADMRGEENDSE